MPLRFWILLQTWNIFTLFHFYPSQVLTQWYLACLPDRVWLSCNVIWIAKKCFRKGLTLCLTSYKAPCVKCVDTVCATAVFINPVFLSLTNKLCLLYRINLHYYIISCKTMSIKNKCQKYSLPNDSLIRP